MVDDLLNIGRGQEQSFVQILQWGGPRDFEDRDRPKVHVGAVNVRRASVRGDAKILDSAQCEILLGNDDTDMRRKLCQPGLVALRTTVWRFWGFFWRVPLAFDNPDRLVSEARGAGRVESIELDKPFQQVGQSEDCQIIREKGRRGV